jgi:serine/threonine protein kinase
MNNDKYNFKDLLLIGLIENFCEDRGLDSDIIIDKLLQNNIIDSHILTQTTQDQRNDYLTGIWHHMLPKNIQPYQPLINNNRFKRDFLINKIIGDNENIFQVVHLLDHQEYIVKRVLINLDVIDPLSESKIMAQLSHPNIIRYHTSWIEYFNNKLYLYIQMESCIGEIINYVDSDMSEDVYLTIMKQLTDSLNYIHNKKIIHRDVKPSNIFYKYDHLNNLTTKLADFGHSVLEYKNDAKIQPSGTQLYLPPKNRKKISPNKADLFSLGLSMYELAIKPEPNQRLLQFDQIRKKKIPCEIKYKYPKLFELIKQILLV